MKRKKKFNPPLPPNKRNQTRITGLGPVHQLSMYNGSNLCF